MAFPWPKVLGIGIALGAAGGALYGRHVAASHRASRAAADVSAAIARGAPVLHVPHAAGPITLDGDTDDLGWLHPPGPARTGAFRLADGAVATPHSDTRLVWSGEYLYLALYASDEDVEAHADEPDQPLPAGDDAFRVLFQRDGVEYAIEVTAKAVIADSIRIGDGAWDRAWSSGAHASREIDGTMNDPKNTDEEWAIELAVPFASIGMRGERGETIGMSVRRCDTPKESPRVCAGWGDGPGERGRIVLD
ncbi:MAG TPA: hypothetical protein VIF62_17415 [Labilithrix sp.]